MRVYGTPSATIPPSAPGAPTPTRPHTFTTLVVPDNLLLSNHADSFVMIRGGHIDLCVLGAMEVSENGDLANWSMGSDDAAPAVGGAMDLVAGVENIVVATMHCTRKGRPKLVRSCSYPLTGIGVVRRIYTDLAIMDVSAQSLEVIRLAPGIDFDYVQQRTEAELTIKTA